METTFSMLAGQPDMGQRLQTRRFGMVRRHVVGAYFIYYRPSPGGVEILLVTHGARDQGRLL